MRAGAHYADTQGSETMLRGVVIANLQALDAHVALIVNGEYAASPLGNQMPGIEYGGLPWKTSKGDEPVARIAGSVHAHAFLVDSASNVDRTSCTRRIGRVLNRTPRLSLSARIRIVPGRRHVKG